MTDSKTVSKLAALARKSCPAPKSCDSAKFSRLASAMNAKRKISKGVYQPEYVADCLANHGAPHMTGPALAELCGVDFDSVIPAPEKY